MYLQWLIMEFLMVLMVIKYVYIAPAGDTIISLLYYTLKTSLYHGFIPSLTNDILFSKFSLLLTNQLYIAVSTGNILTTVSLPPYIHRSPPGGGSIITSSVGVLLIGLAGDVFIHNKTVKI